MKVLLHMGGFNTRFSNEIDIKNLIQLIINNFEKIKEIGFCYKNLIKIVGSNK